MIGEVHYYFRVELDRTGASSLGLSLVDYTEISHRGFDLPRGTYVKSLDTDSPAERAGLKFGDRIIGVSNEAKVLFLN